MRVWTLVFVVGCTGTLKTSGDAEPDRDASIDAPGLDAAIDAPGVDAPGVDAPGVDAPGTDACVATTCEAEGAECGTIDDGCGVALTCGTCTGEEVCGGDGTANQCAVPPECPPPPPGSTAAQITAFDHIADIRASVGAPCLTMVAEINEAAQGHADYGELNAGDPSCRSSGHDQTAGCPGFTGARFTNRLSAAGYSGGSNEIVHFFGDPVRGIDGWLITLWHRVPVVLPQSDHFGHGSAAGWDVEDYGRRQAVDGDGIWFYPYEGQTISGRGGNESPPPPDPPAACGAGNWGTFVTIMFGSNPTSVDVHTLTGPSGAVEHNWITPGMSSFLAGTVYAMVPCPLASGDYTIRVQGTHRSGMPFDRSSTFTVP